MPQKATHLELSMDAVVEENQASNVVGVIPGTDASLRDEYVWFTPSTRA